MKNLIILIITLAAFAYLCGNVGEFAHSLKSYDRARIETALAE